MCRVIALVIIAAVLPAVTLADEKNVTTVTPIRNCSLNTKELNDTRKNLRHCWDDVINIFLGQPGNIEMCHNINDFEGMVELFLTKANATCPDTWGWRNTTFTDMLKKTSQHTDVFQTFYNQRCKSLRTYIDECYNNSIIPRNFVKPRDMGWRNKYHLQETSQLACDLGNLLKECTIDKLKKNCPNTVAYATLMYDESLKNCPVPPRPPPEMISSSAKITASSKITVLATVPLILVQYLLKCK